MGVLSRVHEAPGSCPVLAGCREEGASRGAGPSRESKVTLETLPTLGRRMYPSGLLTSAVARPSQDPAGSHRDRASRGGTQRIRSCQSRKGQPGYRTGLHSVSIVGP